MMIVAKTAIIEIGYHLPYEFYTNPSEYDVYYFPEDITEWELVEEIRNLVEFYDDLVYPIFWPPHLRKEKIITWVEKCQEGTQCNIFCKNYEKGCILNATK